MKIRRTIAVGLAMTGGLMASGALSQQPAKKFLNLEGSKPPGYTHVVTSRPGRMIFISGQGGSARDGKMPSDFSSQTKNTFENIGRCLSPGRREIRRHCKDQLLRHGSVEHNRTSTHSRPVPEYGRSPGLHVGAGGAGYWNAAGSRSRCDRAGVNRINHQQRDATTSNHESLCLFS